MIEQERILPPHEEQESAQLAQTAKKLFIKASLEYPASVTAQASSITLACKASGQNPSELGESLISDKATISEIMAMAQRMHEKKKVFKKLDELQVKEIIYADFNLARDMMILDAPRITKILDRSDHYPKGVRGEAQYIAYVRDQIFLAKALQTHKIIIK